MNGDVGQKPITAEAGPSSPRLKSPLSSPDGKKHRFAKSPTRQKTTFSQKSHNSRHSASSPLGEQEDELGSLEDGCGGATIFSTRDRPDLVKTESYAVKDGRPDRRTSFDARASAWKLPSFPSIPNIPELPALATFSSKQGAKDNDRARRSNEEVRNEQDETLAEPHSHLDPKKEAEMLKRAEAKLTEPINTAVPLTEKLADLHAKHPNMDKTSKPLLPMVAFPNQGTGKSSEFNQDAPIWSRQPFKILYLIYFGLSVGFVFLPWFAFTSIFPSLRPRQSWTWKRSTLVKLYRHGARLTFRTYTSLSRDITKEVPHSKTVRAKFVWVDALPDELIRGQIRSTMKLQNLKSTRTCGFWYGERTGGGGVGQKATVGEKVVYHLHGGAYWIGTAHEKDVTAAVNMQVLRALNVIYDSRLPESQSKDEGHTAAKNGIHPSNDDTANHNSNRSGGHCKRSFSLDYRLCVPGKPEMGSFPAALIDALAGYRYLLNECGFEAKNVIVAGDSAGGNLGLAMCRYIRDEKIAEMPGAMVLLSPWADASRSHSGPRQAPNQFSSVVRNGNCDIISPSVGFRNTAVSALLGRLAARETYHNPYISSISLQLAGDKGGTGPNWGFEGFPRRIYICTGSAELSYDQHLTLAYRLAAATKDRVPLFRGDQLSIDEDPFEMAARLSFPRPQDYEITLWPSAHNTPVGTPLAPPTGWNAPRRTTSRGSDRTNGSAKMTNMKAANSADSTLSRKSSRSHAFNGGIPEGEREDDDVADTHSSANVEQSQTVSSSTSNATNDIKMKAGGRPNENGIKEEDMQKGADVTHENDRKQDLRTDLERSKGGQKAASRSNSQGLLTQPMTNITEGEVIPSNQQPAEESYFGLGGEDRQVILDECKDAIHDYTLFDWYEPERGRTWARIAQWIDEEV